MDCGAGLSFSKVMHSLASRAPSCVLGQEMGMSNTQERAVASAPWSDVSPTRMRHPASLLEAHPDKREPSLRPRRVFPLKEADQVLAVCFHLRKQLKTSCTYWGTRAHGGARLPRRRCSGRSGIPNAAVIDYRIRRGSLCVPDIFDLEQISSVGASAMASLRRRTRNSGTFSRTRSQPAAVSLSASSFRAPTIRHRAVQRKG